MKDQIRLRHISRRAGVSTATVSRVLNNKPNVSDESRKAVLDAIGELGGGRPPSKKIGLIIPNTSNPYFSQLAYVFERELEISEDASVLVVSSDDNARRELALLQRLKGLDVDGLIYISSGGTSGTIPALIAEGDLPVVVFDRRVRAGNLDFVTVDSRPGISKAVDYLQAFGHSEIAYLNGLEHTETAISRFESFRDSMGRNGMDINEEWIFEGDYLPESGVRCASRILAMGKENAPTAIICANDLMAIGLMQRLQQGGWKIPKHISVVGFDGIQDGKWYYPSLTTIEQPVEQMVTEAVRLLRKRLDNKHKVPIENEFVSLDPRLIPRDSVSSPRPDKDSGPRLRLALDNSK